MGTATLSIRIRRELKEKMMELKDVDWRSEIEKFIEEKIKEAELRRVLNSINDILRDVGVSKEPAWKTIREFREER